MSYLEGRCRRAVNAIQSLRYSDIKNFKNDVELCKKRGVLFEVHCDDLVKLRKFKAAIDELQVPTGTRTKEILENILKLEFFGELG